MKKNLSIELSFEDGVYTAFLADDCGGSGISVEGKTPKQVASQLTNYIKDYANLCMIAQDLGDGRMKLRLSGDEVVILQGHFDIVGISEGHHSISIKSKRGKLLGTCEGHSLPVVDEVDDEFIEMIENCIY